MWVPWYPHDVLRHRRVRRSDNRRRPAHAADAAVRLAAARGRARRDVWVKHENHTPTGAFKVRGGLVYMDRLVVSARACEGWSARPAATTARASPSPGRPLAWPSRSSRRTATAPTRTVRCVGFGAELIEHGDDFQAAREHAVLLAEERGLEMVPSFHRDLCLGVATYAHELFDRAGELDAVYVPVGMGSGICGLITVRDLLGLPTEIIGVVSEDAPATALSFAAGHVCQHRDIGDVHRRRRLPCARSDGDRHHRRRGGADRGGQRRRRAPRPCAC